MIDRQEEPEGAIIDEALVKTLLPFFSWFLSQVSSTLFGCRLTLVLRNPTAVYTKNVIDSWGKSDTFTRSQVLSLLTSSGRRRARNMLKRTVRPLVRGMKISPECQLCRRFFQEKWNGVENTNAKKKPAEARMEIDIDKLEKERVERFTGYTAQDVREAFPVGQTPPGVSERRVRLELGNYEDAIASLLWEATNDQELIRTINLTKSSKIWKILGFDPCQEPEMEKVIDWSFDFAAGQVDSKRIMDLVRWTMGRLVMSQFGLHQYSARHEVSLETKIGDDLTLGDAIADDKAQKPFDDIFEQDALDRALGQLPASQREAAELFRKTDPYELRLKLGDKKYKAVERNYQRALKRLANLRQSGELPS